MCPPNNGSVGFDADCTLDDLLRHEFWRDAWGLLRKHDRVLVTLEYGEAEAEHFMLVVASVESRTGV